TEIDPRDPPPEGSFFFRACVSSSASAPVGYTLFVLPQARATDYTLDIGWHIAALEPGGKACGSFGQDQDRRVGGSDVPVGLSVDTFDGGLDFLVETAPRT